MISKLKVLLGLTDDLQDDVLAVILESVTAHVSAYIGKPAPEELDFIILELATRRYQRLGSEGLKSDTTEGHSISFYDLSDELDPYKDILDKYKDDEGDGRTVGSVRFY